MQISITSWLVACVCVAVIPCIYLSVLFLHPAIRTCSPSWRTARDAAERMRLAIVTMQDTRKIKVTEQLAELTGVPVASSPMDVLALTWKNKAHYASTHGYTLINGSEVIDSRWPPSWSKIILALRHLPGYDWVFYLDADTFITNHFIRLEDILPARGGADFVLTSDQTGVNAGAWLIRNTPWSQAFLEKWWNSKSFARTMPGDTKSGDNDALKWLIQSMPQEEAQVHVAIAPQCAFNSYIWRSSLRQVLRLLVNPVTVLQGMWRPDDFVLHLAGFRDKGAALQHAGSRLRGAPGLWAQPASQQP